MRTLHSMAAESLFVEFEKIMGKLVNKLFVITPTSKSFINDLANELEDGIKTGYEVFIEMTMMSDNISEATKVLYRNAILDEFRQQIYQFLARNQNFFLTLCKADQRIYFIQGKKESDYHLDIVFKLTDLLGNMAYSYKKNKEYSKAELDMMSENNNTKNSVMN